MSGNRSITLIKVLRIKDEKGLAACQPAPKKTPACETHFRTRREISGTQSIRPFNEWYAILRRMDSYICQRRNPNRPQSRNNILEFVIHSLCSKNVNFVLPNLVGG